ncbi:MAG: DUF3373 domain-containing protein [Nitrospiraceae bacterium]|nr:DUF3373 domain-containing protein [Nitrospiraceae bacterium]
MKRVLALLFLLWFLAPAFSFAADQSEIMQRIDAMTKELERLKQQMQEMQNKEAVKEERLSTVEKKAEESAKPSWLEIGGDYRARYDYLGGRVHDYTNASGVGVAGYDVTNGSLLTNRFGLNLKAKATEDVQVKARLLMYKVWGHSTTNNAAGTSGETNPVVDMFFSDRSGVFDGSYGHVPTDNILRVDQVYATWSNILDQPLWFSVGRRPSTGGIPTNLRQNTQKIGTAGVPGLLVDYAFDGATIGFAPDIDALPGSYVKLCYGKGFDSGFRSPSNSIKDVNMVGLNVVPIDKDNFHLEFQWNRAMDIFDNFPDSGVTTNLGNADWFGTTVTGKIGNLNLFLSAATSKSHPNNNLYNSQAGLLYDAGSKQSRSGYAFYLGGRYDISSTGTKIGAEYNQGSKYWFTFAPAADDMWTSKLGTKGNVYEIYLIQELNQKPVSKIGKAFFRLGYQYYTFKYTGSNGWVGEPKKISDLTTADTGFMRQQMAPVKSASDIYLTFDVLF